MTNKDPIDVIRSFILDRTDSHGAHEEALAALDQLEAEIKAKDEALVDVYSAGFKANQALRSVAPQWQPIETAPNCEWVMVWSCKYDTVHTARNNGGWEICNPHMDDDSGIWDCFTHWMPLPAAPTPPEARMTNVTEMPFMKYDSLKKMKTKVLCNMIEGMCINMVVSDQMYHPVREAINRLHDFDKAIRQLKEFYDEDKNAYMTPAYAAALAFADNLLEEWIDDEQQ